MAEQPNAAVRCEELVRRYGEGEAPSTPSRRHARLPSRSADGHRRAVRLRQVDADAHARRARPADVGLGLDRRHRDHGARRQATSPQLRRDKLGFVFQFFNLVPVLNAEENITLPVKIAGGDVDRAWLGQLLDTVGLTDRRDAPAVGALGRPAAAGRDRACADDEAGRGLRRRADGQPRLEVAARTCSGCCAGRWTSSADGSDGDARPARGFLRGPRGRAHRRPDRPTDGRGR